MLFLYAYGTSTYVIRHIALTDQTVNDKYQKFQNSIRTVIRQERSLLSTPGVMTEYDNSAPHFFTGDDGR